MKATLFIYFLLLGLFFSRSLAAQYDTLYLDSDFQPTEKGSHRFYRIIDTISTDSYKIRDFYGNHQLQMMGFSTKTDPLHFVGTVFYYNEDGHLTSAAEHKSENITWCTFYSKSGIKTSLIECTNGEKHGRAFFYNVEGEIISKAEFKNNKPYSGEIPFWIGSGDYFNLYEYVKGESIYLNKYYANSQIAMKGTLVKNKSELSQAIYYSPDGKILGTCIYTDKLPVDGVHVEYYDKTFFSFESAKIKFIDIYSLSELLSRKSYDHGGNFLGECLFKNNGPYEGKVLISDKLMTYREGIINGEVIDYNSSIKNKIYSYIQHDDVIEGRTVFFYPFSDSTAVGYIKSNEPYEGFVFRKNELCEYKNGIRHGKCITFERDGSQKLIRYYIEGKLQED